MSTKAKSTTNQTKVSRDSKDSKDYKNITGPSYFEIDLGHRFIKARKWKGRERKDFKKALLDNDVEKATEDILIRRCLENPDEALSSAELKYVLIQLRKHSLKDTFNFEYVCDAPDCLNKNKLTIKLDDVSVLNYEPWKEVKVNNNVYGFQNVQNSKFYNKNQDPLDDVKEMSFYISYINSNESMTFDEVQSFLDDLDIDEFDELFEEFDKMRCTINDVLEVQCEKCKAKKKFEFDEIQGFIPDNWLK